MNKKELFEAVIELPVDYSGSRPKIDKLTTLELIKLQTKRRKSKFHNAWVIILNMPKKANGI